MRFESRWFSITRSSVQLIAYIRVNIELPLQPEDRVAVDCETRLCMVVRRGNKKLNMYNGAARPRVVPADICKYLNNVICSFGLIDRSLVAKRFNERLLSFSSLCRDYPNNLESLHNFEIVVITYWNGELLHTIVSVKLFVKTTAALKLSFSLLASYKIIISVHIAI